MLGSAAWLVTTADIAGGLAAALAFAGGLVLAWRYRRKATVTISADVHGITDGFLIAARPSVSSVGPLRLHFARERGAEITVTEVLATDSGDTEDGESAPPCEAFPTDDKDKLQFVGQGETLTSSVVFRIVEPSSKVLGWTVSLNITARGWLRKGLSWEDRVFVPLSK